MKKFKSVYGATVIVSQYGDQATLEVKSDGSVILPQEAAWGIIGALEAIAGRRPQPKAADHPVGTLVEGTDGGSLLVKIAKDSWVTQDTDDAKSYPRTDRVSVYRDQYIDEQGYEVVK